MKIGTAVDRKSITNSLPIPPIDRKRSVTGLYTVVIALPESRLGPRSPSPMTFPVTDQYSFGYEVAWCVSSAAKIGAKNPDFSTPRKIPANPAFTHQGPPEVFSEVPGTFFGPANILQKCSKRCQNILRRSPSPETRCRGACTNPIGPGKGIHPKTSQARTHRLRTARLYRRMQRL